MTTKPNILSIAGYDPTAGAGVLADVKTFEQHGLLGFAVSTCLTYQTEDQFLGISWHSKEEVFNQLNPLLERYDIKFVKIGLINLDLLKPILKAIPEGVTIIWDPVLSASSGFDFNNFSEQTIVPILKRITLVTPNLSEYRKLKLQDNSSCSVLLKGGHASDHKNDELIYPDGKSILIEGKKFMKPYQKHGTGCVLSSVITSNLALGKSLEVSCRLGKSYVEELLQSNDSLLGYHKK